MSLPVGVTTRTLLVPRDFDTLGNYATLKIVVTPQFGGTATRLVWSATGESYDSIPVAPPTQTEPDGDPTESLDLPIVDQSGWLDGSNNPITMFSFGVSVTPTFTVNGLKVKTKSYNKTVQLLSTDTSPVRISKFPDGTVAAPTVLSPSAVTSVAGELGPVIPVADLVAALAASGLVAPVVTHGTSTTVARPAGASVVIWYGTATPANKQPQDIWTSTT